MEFDCDCELLDNKGKVVGSEHIIICVKNGKVKVVGETFKTRWVKMLNP